MGSYTQEYGFLNMAVQTTLMRVEFLLKELDNNTTKNGGNLNRNDNSSKKNNDSSYNNSHKMIDNSSSNDNNKSNDNNNNKEEDDDTKLKEIQLHEKILLHKSRLEHMPLHCAIKDRLSAQQTVLFNLISQEDSRLNLGIASDSKELAAASKRDSSSMKIIAILTTLFLPGTFISTLLSMPIFNWEVSTISEVSAKYMWVYWAITIPLTILVMGMFGGYALYQEREKKQTTKRARQSIWDKAAGRGAQFIEEEKEGIMDKLWVWIIQKGYDRNRRKQRTKRNDDDEAVDVRFRNYAPPPR
ncbi:hypothetical protein QBC38DRAFT_486115 [Podospora fimiseda]|uniref:Uncharacterized protein n=1 Tax=Podospora fimiseda TaxID=252190 RepID=A0AAN7BIY5_9PEZI|nr:hypothetical protein QBC38DRAFT_486115 [Podospora fimiseda]